MGSQGKVEDVCWRGDMVLNEPHIMIKEFQGIWNQRIWQPERALELIC